MPFPTISKRFETLWPGLLRIDPTLLTFLLLFSNVKLAIKLLALLIVLVLPSVRRKLSFRGLPLFYPAVICIACINYLLSAGFRGAAESVAFVTAIGFWIVALLSAAVVRQLARRLSPQVFLQTITVFFLLNGLVTLVQYLLIVWETGALNPYRYQGEFQKYFMGTGDYIRGISFDTSITNAALNAMGALFFLHHRKVGMTLLCLGVLLYTGSNLIILLCFGLLILLFVFRSTRLQKSVIVAGLLLAAIFFGKISPQNNEYVEKMLAFFLKKDLPKPALTGPAFAGTSSPRDDRRRFAKAFIDSMHAAQRQQRSGSEALVLAARDPLRLPEENIHSAPYQHRDDTNAIRAGLLHFIEQDPEELARTERFSGTRMPGKWLALKQSVDLLIHHPRLLPFGTGAGNYSSKLAFRATGLGIAGSYPGRFRHIDQRFEKDHLALYLYFFSQRSARHSILNHPGSVYDQVLTEYGVVGLAALLVLYFGFFARNWRRAYVGPLLLFIAGLFFTDYWFEALSVVPFAELLLFAQNEKGGMDQ